MQGVRHKNQTRGGAIEQSRREALESEGTSNPQQTLEWSPPRFSILDEQDRPRRVNPMTEMRDKERQLSTLSQSVQLSTRPPEKLLSQQTAWRKTRTANEVCEK